jgi:NitT/TauT family transport system permease protein
MSVPIAGILAGSGSARRWTPSARQRRLIVGTGTILAILVLWEVVVDIGLVDPIFLSSPSRIVIAGIEPFRSGDIWPDIKASTAEFAFGYLAAIAVGIPIGLLMGLYRHFNYMVGPFIDILNAVPRVTFLPILILWFGIGLWSKLAVVFLGALIPITVATYTGVRSNEARFVKVARSFSASRWKLVTSIILPGTVPYLFTGLKYGAGRALLGVVVGEIYASTTGIGHMIADAGNVYDTATVFLGVFLFMAAGIFVSAILNRIERHFDRWRPQEQQR